MELLKRKTKRNNDEDKENKNKINEMTIIYKIENVYRIKLFGEEFIKNNEKNCKIII